MNESNLGVVINVLDAKLGQAACAYELNALAYASPQNRPRLWVPRVEKGFLNQCGVAPTALFDNLEGVAEAQQPLRRPLRDLVPSRT